MAKNDAIDDTDYETDVEDEVSESDEINVYKKPRQHISKKMELGFKAEIHINGKKAGEITVPEYIFGVKQPDDSIVEKSMEVALLPDDQKANFIQLCMVSAMKSIYDNLGSQKKAIPEDGNKSNKYFELIQKTMFDKVATPEAAYKAVESSREGGGGAVAMKRVELEKVALAWYEDNKKDLLGQIVAVAAERDDKGRWVFKQEIELVEAAWIVFLQAVVHSVGNMKIMRAILDENKSRLRDATA